MYVCMYVCVYVCMYIRLLWAVDALQRCDGLLEHVLLQIEVAEV